jgi:hypothetical protein
MVTPLQNAVIVGGLLGDMHIQKTPASTNRCRLRICYSLRQKEYVDWKHGVLLDPFCEGTKPPYLANPRPAKPEYMEYMFYTSYRDEFIPYRTAWYQGRGPGLKTTKVVPANIKQLLVDPIALAVWYLDDGTKRAGYNACRFATQSFSFQENELLALCLKENFGLVATIETWRPTKSGKEWCGLCLPSRNRAFSSFKDIIYPFVEAEMPSMLHKLK